MQPVVFSSTSYVLNVTRATTRLLFTACFASLTTRDNLVICMQCPFAPATSSLRYAASVLFQDGPDYRSQHRKLTRKAYTPFIYSFASLASVATVAVASEPNVAPAPCISLHSRAQQDAFGCSAKTRGETPDVPRNSNKSSHRRRIRHAGGKSSRPVWHGDSLPAGASLEDYTTMASQHLLCMVACQVTSLNSQQLP